MRPRGDSANGQAATYRRLSAPVAGRSQGSREPWIWKGQGQVALKPARTQKHRPRRATLERSAGPYTHRSTRPDPCPSFIWMDGLRSPERAVPVPVPVAVIVAAELGW
ncbi:hypothetical protein ZWY2020_022445 [Hordeum vulgare]|nr:hypothetical protein ZWY2020_022445 [Hordeum vulgare]